MTTIEMGHIPESVEKEIEDDLDFRGALRIMAEDINESCEHPDSQDGMCALSKQLLEAREPIHFSTVEAHMPTWVDYTAHDVIALYCTIAVFNEGSPKSAMAKMINKAIEKVDTSHGIEYINALREFDSLIEKTRDNSAARYTIWKEACYA